LQGARRPLAALAAHPRGLSAAAAKLAVQPGRNPDRISELNV
jgi:hypothetical protein